MTSEALDAARERLRPYVERGRAATGWGFDVHNRPLVQRNWDYDARTQELMRNASTVLDIGTGGGERFAEYREAYRGRAIATEAWPPNAPIAGERLRPLAVEVVHCDDECLPFAGASFDLVLNCHAALDPAEVGRVLRPGGRLLTEQVWGHWRELKRYFPNMNEFPGLFYDYTHGLRAAGLEMLDARAHIVPAAYAGLGDLVFMLCVASWTEPDLDPLGTHLETLLRIERDCTTPDGLVLSDGAFLIEARRPSADE